PVRAVQMLDIGSHRDNAATRFEATVNFVKGAAQRIFVGQVFEEIAGKDQIETIVFERPFRGTILKQTLDSGDEAFGSFRIKIHGKALAGGDLIDEFSVPTTQVQDCVIRLHVTLKIVRDEDSPNRQPIT